MQIYGNEDSSRKILDSEGRDICTPLCDIHVVALFKILESFVFDASLGESPYVLEDWVLLFSLQS